MKISVPLQPMAQFSWTWTALGVLCLAAGVVLIFCWIRRHPPVPERRGEKPYRTELGRLSEVQTRYLLALDRQHVSLPVEDIKTMVLYPVSLEPLAIRFSAAQRKKGIEAACVRFQADKVLDDYRRYGSRNQFGGIIYFRSAEEVYAINLKTGETKRIEVKGYM